MAKGLIEGFPKLAKFAGGPTMFTRYDENGRYQRANIGGGFTIDFPSAAGRRRNVKWNYVKVNIDDLVVLVYPRTQADYSNALMRGQIPTTRDCFYFVPLNALITKIIPITCLYRWKAAYKYLPKIDLREIVILDENWIEKEKKDEIAYVASKRTSKVNAR